jgi:hypothetical protein
MAKRIVALMAVLILVTVPIFAEIELGFGLAPSLGTIPSEASQGFFNDSTKVIHAGYSFAWLFYASYDGFILPPYSVSQMTGVMDTTTGSWSPGYYRPGFLNTFNVGIRPRIGPVMISASIGANSLYIYRQGSDGLTVPPVGVNLRVGAGLKLGKLLGVMVSGTSVFSDFNDLSTTMTALTGNDAYLQQIATDRILNNLFPSVVLSLYL